MNTYTHDGTTIAYRDEGSGPAIVFLHNGGTSSTIWREQIATLSASHRTLAIDLPGFGASPLPDPPTTLGAMVDLVGAFIDDLELAPVTLVGNCMGSNIAVQVSRAHPDRVTGVLAVNPLTEASFGGGGIGFVHKMKHVAAGPARSLRSISRRIGIPKLVGAPTLRFQLGRRGVAKGLQHDPELLACQFRADQMPALVDVLDDMDAYGELDTAETSGDVPIWVAWGTQNRVLSRSRADGLEDRLHAERVELIDDAGHLAMLEDPDRVTGLVTDLLDATVPVSQAS
jgi:pimeloyl-ACP methyl ester carboxylesterase